ncbi:hypothetical protein [Spongiibacter tropicus]|uniref:hypothetical protein n=1 Tax=Spongiibacter tropicus TaxID=454602 RepID=UPI0035BE2928
MRKAGLFKVGYSSTLSWSRNGQPAGSISYRIESDERMVLAWRYREHDSNDDWQDAEQVISLSTSPCNYGGVRHWLHCPSCTRRGDVLYMTDSGFYCRKCCRLNYQSQREGKADRAYTRRNKLHDKLYGEDQRRMWNSTRQRLEWEYLNAEEEAILAMSNVLDKLSGGTQWRDKYRG